MAIKGNKWRKTYYVCPDAEELGFLQASLLLQSTEYIEDSDDDLTWGDQS